MSLQLFLFDKLFRVILKRRFAKNPDVLGLRKFMEGTAARRPAPVPRSIQIETILLGGVPCEQLKSATADSTRALLYVHGGAFVAGSPLSHRPLTWRLAQGLRCPVYAVDYRLAPEHPFPAGLDDVVAAYRGLLAKNIAPEKIAVAGDSAGGNLTLALMLKLKMLGVKLPAALVALSPATDFTHPFESRKSNAKSDAMFEASMFPTATKHYCPGSDLTDPLLSPLRGDLAGFPPSLIFCSQIEMLRDDSVLMAEKLRAAGVETHLENWPRVFHAWPVLADYLPEAQRAIALMVEFLNKKLQGIP